MSSSNVPYRTFLNPFAMRNQLHIEKNYIKEGLVVE